MKKKLWAGLVAGLLLLGMAGGASATLISQDWNAGSGDGLITFDTNTGYKWLDLTATQGVSVSWIWNNHPAGWDYATSQEVIDMLIPVALQNATLPAAERYAFLTPLIALVGATYNDSNNVGSWGWVHNGDGNWGIVGMYTQHNPQDGELDYRSYGEGYVTPFGLDIDLLARTTNDLQNPNVGSWAVLRPASHATPEPATLLLLGTGLAGLVGARRKKKA